MSKFIPSKSLLIENDNDDVDDFYDYTYNNINNNNTIQTFNIIYHNFHILFIISGMMKPYNSIFHENNFF